MKTIKISITVLVLGLISFGIFYWFQNTSKPSEVAVAENQFTKRINQDILAIDTLPNNRFSKNIYSQISALISEFHTNNKLGSTAIENDQWKEILESNLYSKYSDKFITQSLSVLNGNVWKEEDLQFIQDEKNSLIKSSYLSNGSPLFNDLVKIQAALNKYYDISNFIDASRNFEFLATDVTVKFPITDINYKISEAQRLLAASLENELVNNCTRLHDGLNAIPGILFDRHIYYLENKITVNSGQFHNFASQTEYSKKLYLPIKLEIDQLSEGSYASSNFDQVYQDLLSKWSYDNSRAFYHKYTNKRP
jgi:hypothetical protein